MSERRDNMRNRCGLLNEHWYAACLAEELGRGRPIARVVLGERLVLWRDGAGRASANLDRCLHRNALLSEGKVIDGCLACPYHGWMYERSGRCAHVPSMGPGSRAPDGLQLETFPTREQDGLIWVWMGHAPPTDDEAPFPMPHWDEPGWGAYYMKTRFHNDVTNLVENYMDVPHTVFVHSKWFRNASRRRVPTTVERTRDSVLVTYHAPDDEIGFTKRVLNPKNLPLVHTDKFYMPNNTRVDYVWGDEERAFVITSTCTPMSEDDTWVYTLISYKLGAANLLGQRFLPWYTRRVIQQDVDIMDIQRRAFRAHGEPRFHETEADRLHVHIEALRAWEQSGGEGPRPEPVVEEIEMWI
ncbi:MAG: aromatic ring-hydroxylating dioxygenase subunit alpha [Sandaracinaceae bacterium]|nr:aromatic ring-hydroxylating dioxygenase subunit alpha [Sandaracinaceae bacterium]